MSKNIVTKFLHTRMRVSDLDETVDFYKTVFGLEEVKRSESPRGSKLAFLKVPNSEELIEITYFPGSGEVQVQEDLMHLAFQVESLEAFAKHIESLGHSFSEDPTIRENASSFAFMDAPDGYEIEIIETYKG